MDPVVSDPSDLQMDNRYSYVSNRPLSYTDPSGYKPWNVFNKIHANPLNFKQTDNFISNYLLGDKPANVALYEFYQGFGGAAKPFTAFHEEMIRFAHNHPDQYHQFTGLVNVACGWGAPACAAMNADFYASIYTTNISQVVSAAGKAARSKAFIQAAFYGVGQALGASQADATSVDDFEVASNGNLTSNTASTSVGSNLWWAKVAAHSAVGCLAARANDGNCARGAASSAVSAGATDSITQSMPGNYVAQGSALAILGGVTSVISGDKFANGATMALYGYLYNALQSEIHHWHDQSMTRDLHNQGKLTPEARDYLRNDPAARVTIVQDDQDPKNRVHRYDKLHRAASAEIKQISTAFVDRNGISSASPMTVSQARDLVREIRTSNLPGISAHREAIYQFIRTRGILNATKLRFRGGSE